MSDEHEDDVLVLDEEQQLGDEPEEEQPEEAVPSFGDEVDPAAETDLIKHLRRQIRDRDKELSQARRAPVEQDIIVGNRPTMEDCEYDQERFNTELDAWDDRREAKRTQDAKREEGNRKQQGAWEQVQQNYATKKSELRYADKDAAEATAFEALSAQQQAVIAKVAQNPALLIYALGKNTSKLDRLAGIDDPLVLSAEVGRLSAQLENGMTKGRSKAPDPERVVSGGTVRGADKVLAKLEADAERTGDRSALIRHRLESRK